MKKLLLSLTILFIIGSIYAPPPPNEDIHWRQNENKAEYSNPIYSADIYFLKQSGQDYIVFPSVLDLGYYEDYGWKFNLTDTTYTDVPNRYLFKVEATEQIERLNDFIYIIRDRINGECFNPFTEPCPTWSRKLDLFMCYPELSTNNETYECNYDDYISNEPYCVVDFNPECEMQLSADNKTLEVQFYAIVDNNGNSIIK